MSLADRGNLAHERFLSNIKKEGLDSIIINIRDYSFSAVKNWKKEIDLLFIDGDHTYEAVHRDFLDWSPFVKIGGLVAFHDTHFSDESPYVGPGQVVEELVRNSDNWSEHSHTHSLYVVRRRGP